MRKEAIASSQNKVFKQVKTLYTAKGREKERAFVVEGLRFAQEIPKDWEVLCCIMSESFLAREQAYDFAVQYDCSVMTDKVFSQLSDTKTPQGILCVCRIKSFSLESIIDRNPQGVYVLLEKLNDPGNVGTIIRTADAFGISGVLLSEGCVDCFNPKVLRSTMGSIFHVPILQNLNFEWVISLLRKKEIAVYAAHLKAEEFLYHMDFTGGCAFLIGNEARGLEDDTVHLADKLIKIPMPGQAESLNASVCASMLMYEALRQRTL